MIVIVDPSRFLLDITASSLLHIDFLCRLYVLRMMLAVILLHAKKAVTDKSLNMEIGSPYILPLDYQGVDTRLLIS